MEAVTGNLHFKQSLWMILLEVVLDWAFQVAPVVKNQPANAGDARDSVSIPGSGRTPRVEMAIHSSILAWKIPWTEEPGGLQPMGSQRVGHD